MSAPIADLLAAWARELCLGALLAPAGVQGTTPGTLAWTELGPAPISGAQYTGRVSAIACSPTDPQRFFAAGADGGVWRTVDGGQSWEPLTDSMPTLAMGALAIDPTDENVVYAGTGEANYANHSRYGLGLYKSLDGGDHWQHLGESELAGRCFSRLLVDPQNPQRLFAAITRAGGFPELAAAKGHPQATGPLGVFRSLDGGHSWTRLAGGLPDLSATDLAMDPGDPDVLYAGIGRIFGSAQNGVYKSVDGGASWTRLGGGLPTSSVGRISLAVAPSQASRVYALITRPATASGGSASTRGAWRSDDHGASWTAISPGSIQSSYGWYLSVVGVHPTDPDTVFMGGLNLYRSTSAGAGWSNRTPPHVDMHAIAWDAAGRLLVGDDGGVHRSTNLGDVWSSLNDGLGIIQFYAGLSTHPTDDQLFFGGTQDNGTNRHDAPGLGWSQVLGGDGGWTRLDPASPQYVFAEYQGSGNLYRSTNGGGSFGWSGSGISGSDRTCFVPPYLIGPLTPGRMLYATHRIYRSTDHGASWSPISGDLSSGAGAVRALAQSPADPLYVFAATNDGNLQRSTDGGWSFALIDSGNPGWPRVTRELFCDPQDPLTLYQAVASFGTVQVRRTRNAGQSWEPLDMGLPDVPVNAVAVDVRPEKPALFAGTDSGLWVSYDEGVRWQRYGSGLPNAPVIDVLLEPRRNRILVGTQGRGAWSAPLMMAEKAR